MLTSQQIKFIRSLHQKKYRDQNRLYLAEGQNLVREALRYQADAVEMLIHTAKTLPYIETNLPSVQGEVYTVSPAEFSRISLQKTPQEIMAVLKMQEISPPSETGNDLTLVLDRISDPGNMGTLIRLADWFGLRQLVCSEDTVDCYNPKVVQSSMGAVFRVPVSYLPLAEYLGKVREKGKIRVFATSLEGEDIYTADLSLPAVIVIGNEASGISPAIIRNTDTSIRIPDYSLSEEKTESLNAAVAGGIICAEFRRRSR